jgi:hypothetical protein
MTEVAPKERGRFGRIPDYVARISDLSGADFRVLIALATFADKKGICFPSLATLAQKTGIERKNIPRSLAKLERLKVIARMWRPNTSNAYGIYGLLDPASVLDAEDRPQC